MKSSYTENIKKRNTFSPFSIGDLVEYRGNKYTRLGKIIAKVPYGMYPYVDVRIRGFYREYISYVVLLNNGKYIWPHNPRLTFLKSKRNFTAAEQNLFNSFVK